MCNLRARVAAAACTANLLQHPMKHNNYNNMTLVDKNLVDTPFFTVSLCFWNDIEFLYARGKSSASDLRLTYQCSDVRKESAVQLRIL